MSKLYSNGASFGFSLNFDSAYPVDTRFVVNSTTDLYDPKTWVSGKYDSTTDSNNVYVVYPGLRVTVLADKTVYIYTADSVSGTLLSSKDSWTKLSTNPDSSISADEVQQDLDKEKTKITNSSTLKANGSTSYEVATQLIYVPAASGVAAHIALVDKNSKELSTVDVSNLIGNGTLKSSSYDKTTGKLTLIFNQADGTTNSVDVDLSEMLDINDVVVDSTSKPYLEVDLTGAENSQAVFKLVIADLSGTSEGLVKASDVRTYVSNKISGVSKKATTTDGTNVHVTASQTNGVVSIDSVTEDYATVKASGAAVTITDGAKLVTGNDLKTVSDANGVAITNAINTLDNTVTVKSSDNLQQISITQTDGLLKSVSMYISGSDGSSITSPTTDKDLESLATLGAIKGYAYSQSSGDELRDRIEELSSSISIIKADLNWMEL